MCYATQIVCYLKFVGWGKETGNAVGSYPMWTLAHASKESQGPPFVLHNPSIENEDNCCQLTGINNFKRWQKPEETFIMHYLYYLEYPKSGYIILCLLSNYKGKIRHWSEE